MRSPILILALLALTVARARPAAADWEVRRSSGEAARGEAERMLVERPGDVALARRLVKLARKTSVAAIRARFAARAAASTARFADVAAYASLLEALGDASAAADEFGRAAALRPDPIALVGRARCLARAGQRAPAVKAYDEALAHLTSARARRPILEAELPLLDEPADLARELTLRRELADASPRSDAALAQVVDVLARLGRAGEAADLIEARRAKDGALPFEHALRVAELREAAGQGARAADALAALIRQTPRTHEEHLRLAWSRAVAVARRRDGLPALAAVLARDHGPVALDVLGQVRDELGDLEGALEATRAAARARPSAALGRRVITLLDRLGREDEAVAVYEELARRAAGDPKWSLELAERELRRGRRREAGAALDRAASRFAHSPSALAGVAELAGRWGEDARALAAWRRVHALAPRDERGILGLGEMQFAAGNRALARKTWSALRDATSPPAAGHVRFGEVLLEHDLLADARAEAEAARDAAPKHAAAHRLLAQILERDQRPDDAVREWEIVLGLAGGVDGAGARREARTRILTILARDGRGRLDERVRALAERVRTTPADREAALFLAEAQQRLGDQAGAIATLRGVLNRDAARPTGTVGGESARRADADGESTADVTLALVRLLRTTGQPDEAVRRLEELAAHAPARAREAEVQIADLELARHDEADALTHAEEAARLGPGDGQAMERIAAIQERAGDDEQARETYRGAFARDDDPTAGFALARLLERGGDVAGAATVLERVLATATDDEQILEAGRRAIEVDEYLGRLPALEQSLAGLMASGPGAPVHARVYVDVLRRLVPPLYRASAGGGPNADRARLAQHGLRPLLDLVSDTDALPDRALVELLGMLGNKDAAPVLARLAATATDPPRDDKAGAPQPRIKETQLAAVIALGRLGNERGRDVLEKLTSAPEAGLRAAAVWALGRTGSEHATPIFTHALRDGRADVAGLACLGLGRARGGDAVPTLVAVATDVERPIDVRRAAVAGLALAGDRTASPTLLALADSGDEDLERAALLALGALRDRRALPALLDRALLPHAPARDGAAAVLALDLWASDDPLPDEAATLEGPSIDLGSVLAGLVPRVSDADTATLWRDDLPRLRALLGDALARPGERRARALASLDGRDDGVGLEPLVPRGDPIPAPTAAALGTLGAGTRDAVAALLDDPTPDVRAMALRILAKSDDARVTARRLVIAAEGPPATRDAATFVVRRWAATSPGLARALADALGVALAESPAADSRLGLIDALAALGAPGTAGLSRALADPDALVRTAATDALARAPRRP